MSVSTKPGQLQNRAVRDFGRTISGENNNEINTSHSGGRAADLLVSGHGRPMPPQHGRSIHPSTRRPVTIR
jgi:hypothetical protein